MKNSKTISTIWVNLVVETLESNGIDGQEICRLAQIDYQILAKPEEYISHKQMKALWDSAVALTNNESIGLAMGTACLSGPSGALAYSLLTCQTMKESMQFVQPYIRSMSSYLLFDYSKMKDGYLISVCSSCEKPLIPQAVDSIMAYQVQMVNHAFCKIVRPLRLDLARPEPKDRSEYEKFFNCPINFNRPTNAILYSFTDFEREQSTANEIIKPLHEKALLAFINKSSENICDRVKPIIIKELNANNEVTLDSVARELDVSISTLKRRLQEERKTFRNLLDITRKELAKEYLKDDYMTIKQITYQLGFKGTSPFFRAFKRWYGCTPTQFLDRP